MLLFQFTAEQRGEGFFFFFHTAGVLLEHDDMDPRWLPQQMLPCRSVLPLNKGFNEILAPLQAWFSPLVFSANAYRLTCEFPPIDGVGAAGVKRFYVRK